LHERKGSASAVRGLCDLLDIADCFFQQAISRRRSQVVVSLEISSSAPISPSRRGFIPNTSLRGRWLSEHSERNLAWRELETGCLASIPKSWGESLSNSSSVNFIREVGEELIRTRNHCPLAAQRGVLRDGSVAERDPGLGGFWS